MKEGDLSARLLTSSNTIKLSLSTYSPIPLPSLCTILFFSTLLKVFQISKSFLKIVFILRLVKLYFWFEARVYFSFPLLGEPNLRDPVDFFELSKHRVTSQLLNKGRFSTCRATQDQNVS